MSESAAAGITPGPEAHVYSFEHHAAFSTWKNRGMSCKDLPDPLLEALLEDRNFTDEVRKERERRSTALIPPSPTRTRAGMHEPVLQLSLSDIQRADLSTDAKFLKWAERHATYVTPIGLWASFVQRERELREILAHRTLQINTLSVKIEGLQDLIADLRQRTDEIDGKGCDPTGPGPRNRDGSRSAATHRLAALELQIRALTKRLDEVTA